MHLHGGRTRLGRRALTAGLGLLAAGICVPMGAAAQVAAPLISDLEQPPRPVNVFLADRPIVTVEFSGDFGPVRVTGPLERVPKETLRLTDATGRTREAVWSEVRSLTEVRTATEGLPVGSYTVYLIGDASPTSGVGAAGGYLSTTLPSIGGSRGGWRLTRLPEGEMAVTAGSLGTLAFPVSRITSFVEEPVRGSITQMPAGTIAVEVLAGKRLNVPLTSVEFLRRDLRAGTIALSLADGQTVTGKLLELPKVALAFTDEHPAIPLERIVQLEIAVPALSRSGGLGLNR